MIESEALELLDETVRVLDSFNAGKICLFQGTALGAYREKGKFIEDDYDIDIVIFNDIDLGEVSKSFKLGEIKDLSKTFLGVKYNTAVIDIHIGKFIDDFFVVDTPMNTDRYPKNIFESLDVIKLYDREFYVPQDIEKYLYLCYGPEWHIPKIYTDHDNLMERIWKV